MLGEREDLPVSFACRLREPAFRRFAESAGYAAAVAVLTVEPGISWSRALRYVRTDEGPVLLARRNLTAEFGWELRFLPGRAAEREAAS